jgi:putative PIN family toxin of toxin-antitoxin system
MRRHRIVLDTNVILSAVLFAGKPRRLLELVISGAVECTLSFAIVDELRDVLMRPKFGLSPAQAARIVEELHEVCEVIRPGLTVRGVVADPSDSMLLECALASGADFVVSGDAHLVDIGSFRGIRIVTPAAYLALPAAGREGPPGAARFTRRRRRR